MGPQTEAANVDDITITIPAAVVRLTAVALPTAVLGSVIYSLAGAVPALLAAITSLGAFPVLYQWLFTQRPPR